MSAFFLDTGYLIALEAADDQHHKKALRQSLTFDYHFAQAGFRVLPGS